MIYLTVALSMQFFDGRLNLAKNQASVLQDVTLHSGVHRLCGAEVIVPVENVDDEVAQGEHNSANRYYFLLILELTSDREILSIFETELSGSSGSVMARVIHLQHEKYDEEGKIFVNGALTFYTDILPRPRQS